MVQLSFMQIVALLAIAPSLIAAVPVTVTSSALSCPASDGQTVTVGADSFDVLCGYDYYGGDLSLSWETSFDNCLTTCERTTGCIVVSYTGGACYMKNEVRGAQPNPSVWAAKKVIAGSPAVACPASDRLNARRIVTEAI